MIPGDHKLYVQSTFYWVCAKWIFFTIGSMYYGIQNRLPEKSSYTQCFHYYVCQTSLYSKLTVVGSWGKRGWLFIGDGRQKRRGWFGGCGGGGGCSSLGSGAWFGWEERVGSGRRPFLACLRKEGTK